MTADSSKALRVLEGLVDVKAALADLRMELNLPKPPPAIERAQKLKSVVDSIGQARPARPLVCPDAYIEQWRDFLAGRRRDLEARAVRYLCWEPEIATDVRFVSYLEKVQSPLRARSLQGLVRCCHTRWGPSVLGPREVRRKIENLLRDYDGTNRIVDRWKQNCELVIGEQGPSQICAQLLEQERPINELCDALSIDPQSAFVLHAMREAGEWGCKSLTRYRSVRSYLLPEIIFWEGWALEDFKRLVGDIMLALTGGQDRSTIEALKQLVLQDDRLRDPRLPANAKNWIGVTDEARRRFIQWLSRDDIEFFFEHVLPKGADPHGRKRFWLRYVKQVQMSRPLLSWNDEARLKRLVKREQSEPGNFGQLEAYTDTSAFLLDFGALLVVEFSKVGNACHVYERAQARRVIPDFWSTDRFMLSGKKGLT
jgi:hypothetical protein